MDIQTPTPRKRPNTSPWFTMWTHPRATMRHILVERRPGLAILWVFLAGFIYGVLTPIIQPSTNGPHGWNVLNTGLFQTMVFSGLISAAFSLIGMFLTSWLYKWIGSWFGGQGSSPELRQAIGWSMIVLIWANLFPLLEILVFGTPVNLFVETSGGVYDLNYFLWIVFCVLELVANIWWIFTLIFCVAEVHKFGFWKAFATVIISSLIILLICVLLTGALVGFGHVSTMRPAH